MRRIRAGQGILLDRKGEVRAGLQTPSDAGWKHAIEVPVLIFFEEQKTQKIPSVGMSQYTATVGMRIKVVIYLVQDNREGDWKADSALERLRLQS
jgi:hypothetical protein